MKILALSDIHGDKALAKEMAKKAKENNVDLVLLAGDLVDMEGSVEGIIGPFKEQNLEVGVINGNHEGLAEINFLVERYNIKNLHGYSMRLGDVGIFGCGYSNIGPNMLPEEEVLKALRRSHEHIKDSKKKIMLTHTHPQGSILGLNIFPGSEGVKKAIDEFQPDLHICGHVHETAGMEEIINKTKTVNVGRKGKIFEF